MKHTKIFFGIALLILLLTGCEGSKENIISKSKNIIEQDLGTDCNIGQCYYNEEVNVAYIKFFSMSNGEDDAVIMLDDNTIYYGSVYSTIKEDDYDKIIEYGDYALYSSQVNLNDEDWVELDVE